jgi:hypothetical protein
MVDDRWKNHAGLAAGVDIDMDRAREHLGLPEAELDNPWMQELVGLLVRVEELQQHLFDASLQAGTRLPPFLDGAHSLGARYHAAEQLLRVVLALLREGLGRWSRPLEAGSDSLAYLEEKLQAGLADYDLTMVARGSRKPR